MKQKTCPSPPSRWRSEQDMKLPLATCETENSLDLGQSQGLELKDSTLTIIRNKSCCFSQTMIWLPRFSADIKNYRVLKHIVSDGN